MKTIHGDIFDDVAWVVSLVKTKCYWFDLVVDPLEHVDTRSEIAKDLEEKERIDRNSKDSRFVYFFACRPRVRIDTSSQLYFNTETGIVGFNVLIGRNKTPVKLETKIADPGSVKSESDLTCTDKTLRLFNGSDNSVTISVHDLLQECGIHLDSATEVLYVGSSVNQARRILDREHRGICDSIYFKGVEENDFFFFSNLFSVHEVARSESSRVSLIQRKVSMSVQECREECAVVENGLIRYFGCKAQEINKEREEGALRNAFATLQNDRGVSRIAFDLQVDASPNYLSFFSRNIAPQDSHNFMYSIDSEELVLQDFSSAEKMIECMRHHNDV